VLLGVYHGYFTDTAITVAVGKIPEKTKQLLNVTKKALEIGIKQCVVGNTVADIGRALQILVGGSAAGFYTSGGRRSEIRVRLGAADRSDAASLGRIHVRNARGELVPLGGLVKIAEDVGPRSISREDRARAIAITANLAPGASQAAAIEKAREIAARVLPEGIHAVPSGSAKALRESFQGLLFALLFGIVISYMVLASQFNSFRHPFTVFVALPFSVTGAFLALRIAGQSLNIYSMIGLILLMGIVKKNSIILVDLANRFREKGATARDALVEACPIRLRPILMTSLSTIVAAIPPALHLGPGSETRMPMAVAIVGGMVVSTLLTLFVVPCVYVVLDRGRERNDRLASGSRMP
jgi:HAE1 family hydrophobic/amphiphilic exporter-1